MFYIKSIFNSTKILFIFACNIALNKKFATASIFCNNKNFGMTCCCHGSQYKFSQQQSPADEFSPIFQQNRIPSTFTRPYSEGKQTAALRPYYKVEEETGNIVKVSHPLSALSSRHLLKSKFLAPAKQPQQSQQSPALLHALPADATHALLIPLIVQAPSAAAAVEPAPPMQSSSGSTTGMPVERGSRQQQSQHERTHCECEEATMTTKLPLINDEKVNKNCCERKRALCGKLIRNTDDKISMEHLLKNLIAKNSNNLDTSDSIDDNLALNRNRDSFDINTTLLKQNETPIGAKFESGMSSSVNTTVAVESPTIATTIITTTAVANGLTLKENGITIQERLKNEFSNLLGIVEENERNNAFVSDKDAMKIDNMPIFTTAEIDLIIMHFLLLLLLFGALPSITNGFGFGGQQMCCPPPCPPPCCCCPPPPGPPVIVNCGSGGGGCGGGGSGGGGCGGGCGGGGGGCGGGGGGCGCG
uniref:Uncharacterized protein n=1 Tax=Globodera rostochiensis TaxID=31243 RepID=A0A914IG21_GLORO